MATLLSSMAGLESSCVAREALTFVPSAGLEQSVPCLWGLIWSEALEALVVSMRPPGLS